MNTNTSFTLNRNLSRYPLKNSKLSAVSAADEYILKYFQQFDENLLSKSITILNDQFGVLSASLPYKNILSIYDSFTSSKAVEINTKTNVKTRSIKYLFDNDKLNTDIILLRIPKSSEILDFYLSMISCAISKETILIASGMTKYTPDKSRAIFSKYGECDITPVYKKSIIFKTTIKPQKDISVEQFISTFDYSESGIKLYSYPGVFANNKIDNGTRFLIQNLPDNISGKVVDFGCGNGIIGATIKKNHSKAQIYSIDDSYIAIESAKLTFLNNNLEGEFYFNDGLFNLELNNLDFVIGNLPFHSENILCQDAAVRHFDEIYKKLKTDGKLITVCNTGLNYKSNLLKTFDEVKLLSKNEKYLVYESTKTS